LIDFWQNKGKEKSTSTLLFLVSSNADSCPYTFGISAQLLRCVSHSLGRFSYTSDAFVLWLFLLGLILAFYCKPSILANSLMVKYQIYLLSKPTQITEKITFNAKVPSSTMKRHRLVFQPHICQHFCRIQSCFPRFLSYLPLLLLRDPYVCPKAQNAQLHRPLQA
jgi:hypothetical protein